MKFTEFFSGKGKALNKENNFYAILFISSARVSGRDSRAGCGGCRFASGAGASRRISAKNFRAVSRDSGFVYFFKKQRLTRTDKNDGFNGEIAQEKRRKSIKNKRKNRRNRKIFPKGIDKTHFMW